MKFHLLFFITCTFFFSNIALAQNSASLFEGIIRPTLLHCKDDVGHERRVEVRAESYAVWESGRHVYTIDCIATDILDKDTTESSSSIKDGNDETAPTEENNENPECDCDDGSIIRIDTRSLEERLPIAGTPYTLRYNSSKVDGRKLERSIKIPLNDINPHVLGFNLSGTYADGRTFGGSFSNTPGQIYNFVWDGKDSLGNNLPSTTVTFTVTYIIAPYYEQNSSVPVSYTTNLAGINTSYQSIGGWSPEVVHYYDSLKGMIFFGNGEIVKSPLTYTGGYYRAFSDDGSEAYLFDATGRHIKTLFGLMGTEKYVFTYDPTWNKISSIKSAYNETTNFSFNPSNGRITAITSPKGLTTILTYDENGYVSSYINPQGEAHSMTYSSDGLLLTFQKPEGETSTFTYDLKGGLIKDEHSGGSSTTLFATSDNSGYPTKKIIVTSEMGRQKERIFNNAYKTDNQGNAFTRDAYGQVGLRYERGSRTTSHNTYSETESYKLDPRVASARYPSRQTLKIGNKTFTTESSRELNSPGANYPFKPNLMTYKMKYGENESTSVFQGTNSTWTSTSSEGRISSSKINSFEQPVTIKQGNLTEINITYESLVNIASITQGQRTTRFSYDRGGNLSQIVDPMKNITKFQRDQMGRIYSKIEPGHRETRYSYDHNGRMTGLTTPNGNYHQFIYNEKELLSEYRPPALGPSNVKTTYEYNDDKDLTKITLPDGREIQYDYIPDGKLNYYGRYDEGFVYFTWNGVDPGPIAVTRGGDIRINKSYFGPYIKSEEQVPGTGGATIAKVEFGFDEKFRHSKVTIKDSNGSIKHIPYYLYDKDDLMTHAGEEAIGRHPELGHMTERKIGKAQVLYSYDPQFGELASIEYRYDGIMKLINSYKRDKLGRISEINDGTGPVVLSYDPSGRFLGREQRGSGSPLSKFVYDKNGNRVSGFDRGVSFEAEYDQQDRLIVYNGTTFTYGLNGELASKTHGSETTNFTYDVFGNLYYVQLPNKSIRYQIDGDNRRTAKMINETIVTRYIWQNQLRLAAELNPDGTMGKQFVYGEGVNSPDYMIYEGKRYFFVKDHRGSVNMVVDVNTGLIAQRLTYSEFGEVLEDTNPGFQPFGFAGGLYDPDTKLVRFGARDYDGRTGRWLSKDPIRFDGGDTNLYGYVMNDPVNSIDKKGTGPVAGAICAAIDVGANAALGLSEYIAQNEIAAAYEQQIQNIQKQLSSIPDIPCNTARRNDLKSQISLLNMQKAAALAQATSALAGAIGGTVAGGLICGGISLLPGF